MFIRNNNSLPPNIIWIKESNAKDILNCFPEISRRTNPKGYTEIAFTNNKKLRDKLKELNIN